MNLKLFPLDTQTCHLTIASYGWTAADLVYLWKVGRVFIFDIFILIVSLGIIWCHILLGLLVSLSIVLDLLIQLVQITNKMLDENQS